MGGLQIGIEQATGDTKYHIWCSSHEPGDFERDRKDKLITETKQKMGKIG